jgi:sec-independent protein translocase protein TatC
MIKKQRKQPTKQAKTRKTERSDNFTFSDHIRELRRRALWVALVLVGTSALAYNYHDLLVQVVMAPLHGEKLVYLTPGGGFSFIFQVTLYAGFVAAAPVLMYQIYGFLKPTLPAHAKKNSIKVALFSTVLMLAGVAYGYLVAVPSALTFLSTFAGTEIIPNLTADSYLSFFLAYIGGLALLFQLPLLLIFWHWIKPMKPGGLLKSERFIVLFAFIAAALITPTPDVVNQAMIAVPLIAIYQIGVVAVLIAITRTRRQEKRVALPSNARVQTVPIPKEPVPALSQVSSPAPQTTPVAVATPRPATRSLDGFSVRPVRTARPVPPKRPLAVPPRPPVSEQSSFIHHRPILRIDGMSPL